MPTSGVTRYILLRRPLRFGALCRGLGNQSIFHLGGKKTRTRPRYGDCAELLNSKSWRMSRYRELNIDAAVTLDAQQTTSEDTAMDKDRIKGSVEQAKGAVKETAGKVFGDKKLETEGKTDKAAGKVQSAVGGLKDAVRGK